MDKKDLDFLREVLPFWEKLEPSQQKLLEDNAALKTYEAGESLHSGDMDCSGLFVLQNGRIRVFMISDSGKEVTLYRLLERDVCLFSASCIFNNITFTLNVEAETKTQAILIPTAVFEKLNKNYLPVSDFVNKIMAARMSDAMWVMEQVLFSSFDRRLAMFLLDQANLVGSDTLIITHEAIANHLGSAREVVTRMLKYFAEEGMVQVHRGGLVITDRKKLSALV